MKKYIAPSLKVVDVNTQSILAGSLDVKGEYNGTLPLKSRGFRGSVEDFDDED